MLVQTLYLNKIIIITETSGYCSLVRWLGRRGELKWKMGKETFARESVFKLESQFVNVKMEYAEPE